MVMGARSLLVLLKLGFELRSSYGPVIDEPLPEQLRTLLEQLPGGNHAVSS